MWSIAVFSLRQRWSAGVGVVFATVALTPQDGPAGTKERPLVARAWTPIEATTFEERQAAHPIGKPAAEPLLALPFGSAADSYPPCFVAAGERIAAVAEPWRYFDRLLPRQPIHDEYLRQRMALADDGLALIDWCRRNHLDDCAELEASRCMDEIDDFQKPAYAPFLKRWLKLRDKRQLAFSFPLPLEGEWFVLTDTSHHHRLKSFAAYAFDIVQKVDDRMFRGKGTQLDDYYAFGQPIIAQADGVVVSVDDDFPDNLPGKIGGFEEANGVIVDYGGGMLADYAHCRQGSAAVKAGDRVTRGQRLAAVGSSGASGLPHLHFSMLDWGYESIRGRFSGEVLKSGRWVASEGEDLKPGTFVRNRVPQTTTGR